MIDLQNYIKMISKYFDSSMVEIEPSDLIDICNRTIAAESERDELKAKLAEMENQEPFRYFVADPRYGSEDMYDQNQIDLLQDGERLSIIPLYTQPKPSAPAQRITEQDARELVESMIGFLIDPESNAGSINDVFEPWMDRGGRTLLAKLNEHREPVAPNDRDRSLSENSDLVKSIQDIWFKSGCAHLMNKTTAMNIIDAVVTANKVEVPDSVKWSLHWLKAALECKSFGWDADQHECALMELNSAQKWLDSLQPLKDGEL